METFGFLKAIARAKEAGQYMHGIAVRGISDPCAGKSGLENASRNAIRNVAATNAAAVLVDLIPTLRALDASLR